VQLSRRSGRGQSASAASSGKRERAAGASRLFDAGRRIAVEWEEEIGELLGAAAVA